MSGGEGETTIRPDDDPEAIWLRDVYQPNATNLTVRAVLVGALIGGVMCISNLYVFFKTGWSVGVTLTACILAFVAFQGLQRVGLISRPLGMLENNALTTVASGAGYMTGGGNMAAFGALIMVTTVRPNGAGMILWLAVIAALGVFAAIPIKRQLINKEGLAFPTGKATAETLHSLHTAAAGGGAGKVKALGIAAGFGALLVVFRDLFKILPGVITLPVSIAGHTLKDLTLSLKMEVVLIGAGALMSFRTGWSLLLGGVFTYGFLAPALYGDNLIAFDPVTQLHVPLTYKEIVKWTVWPGAAILVGAGLTSFALDFRSLGRALAGIGAIFGRKRTTVARGIAAVECPDWWFPAGFVVLGPIVVALMFWMFQIPIWAACIALPLAVVMGFIAARVTGETDVTPTKALGPVTQMLFGALTPGNLSGNIMSANVTGGVGLHAADLLTTLKTGWLLGAKPRHQLYAQLFGVLAGAAVIIPAFNLILPDPSVLGSDQWPAPSCTVWANVSKAFADGLDSLSAETQTAIWIGLVLGCCLTLLEKFAPRNAKPFIPSPSGLGIAMVVPGSNSIAMFIGAAIAEILRRKKPAINERYVVPVASGLIAGESIMGVVVALLVAFGMIAK